MPARIKILIVDDSAFMRQALAKMIAEDSTLAICGVAKNGQEAVDLASQLKPDVVLLDLEMPVMDGMTALRKMKEQSNPAVLVCSSLTASGSHEALAALRAGAADVIAKSGSQFSLDVSAMREELIAKIKAVAHRSACSASQASSPQGPVIAAKHIPLRQVAAIVVGSSTGGPAALERFLGKFPPDFGAPILVAQHMPPTFTQSLASRLGSVCAMRVVHATSTQPAAAGTIYVGEGGKHIRPALRAGTLRVEISTEPATALYRPSVNEMFHAAAALEERCIAVVLTGMGDDGKSGATEIKKHRGLVLTQDFESCVVYGMPKAVNEAGLSDLCLPPEALALATIRLTLPAVALRRAG